MLILFWLSQTWPLPDNKETKFGSSNQEASQSAGKNTGIVLVPCCMWKCVPTAILGGVDISEVPACDLLQQTSSQWGLQKLLQGLVSHELTAYFSVFNLFLTQWIMAILSKGCKLDNHESHNSLKLSFMNIQAFIQILLDVNLSLSQTLLTLLLCVRQTWMTQLIRTVSLWGVIFL